jgi:hypothetical protein
MPGCRPVDCRQKPSVPDLVRDRCATGNPPTNARRAVEACRVCRRNRGGTAMLQERSVAQDSACDAVELRVGVPLNAEYVHSFGRAALGNGIFRRRK